MYRELFGQELGGRNRLVRAKQPKLLPRYATPDEVARVLAQLDGLARVAAMLMYGSGTRTAETMSIRLKDVSLATRELFVRGGKGAKDRTTVIAQAAVPLVRDQIAAVEKLHARDVEGGGGWAPLPTALHRKDPRAGWDLAWQYLFPASVTTVDEKTGRVGRRHLHETVVQRAIKQAVRDAKVARPISAHVLRHCFATELLKNGCDIRMLQRLMGHRDLKTTALYLHILDRPGVGIISPLDRLPPGDTAKTPRDAPPRP
jgi:integron integrase